MARIALTKKYATALAISRDHRVTILDGSVGSGKTTAQVVGVCDRLINGPAGLVAAVGATTESLHTNALTPMGAWLGEGRARIGSPGQRDGIILNRKVLFRGAPNALAAGRIKGADLAGAFVDEVTEIPEDYWRQLGYRMRGGGGREWILGTTNPGNPRHWLYKDLQRARTIMHHDGTVERRDADWRDDEGRPALDLFWARFTMEDNPYLPAAYVADVKASNTGVFYQRNVLGLWVAADGVIYDMWNEPRHVIKTVPADPAGHPALDRITLVADYGTSNPLNLGVYGWHAPSGTVVKAREWRWDGRARKQQLSDEEAVDRIHQWLTGGADGLWPAGHPVDPARFRWCVDPSAPSFMAALRRRYPGVTIIAADNSVVDGIREVQSVLHTGRLVVHESCRYTRDEIAGYIWDPKQQERGIDAPVKTDDHAMDETRYATRLFRPQWGGRGITGTPLGAVTTQTA